MFYVEVFYIKKGDITFFVKLLYLFELLIKQFYIYLNFSVMNKVV